ncbi:MAG: Nramp family divalent metal transporter [Pirellulales bacterium]
MTATTTTRRRQLLTIVGPGLLVAATGVGAGDLATSAFTGGKLGVAVLWAVAVGAFLKYVVNEGLTRWQLATGTTLLEGCVTHLGAAFKWLFLIYLLHWSFLVGQALMSACGATAHAFWPLISPSDDKIIYGIVHSLAAVVLVQIGGYRLFERVMTVAVGVMFVVVVASAALLRPALGEVVRGLFVPTIPQLHDGGLDWTVALLGGVGGTLTVLCYGYWIREEGRTSNADLWTCRVDLAGGYVMTAVFGTAMVVIGSRVGEIDGKGATLVVELAAQLRTAAGGWGGIVYWGFLVGAWGAVFSSLLGVWQSIPYLFTDFWNLSTGTDGSSGASVDTKSWAYRGYLYGLAVLPIIGMKLNSFRAAQQLYAVVGALVIPLLAAVLLYLNNRASLVGAENRNGWKTNVVLVATLVLFTVTGAAKLYATAIWLLE